LKKDSSYHIKKDGRVFRMFSGLTERPIPFSEAKRNYTRTEIGRMNIGESITFQPMYGNDKPVYSTLIRIK
jgi:hypothetical protein